MAFIQRLVRFLLLLALGIGASALVHAHDCGMMAHEGARPASALHAVQPAAHHGRADSSAAAAGRHCCEEPSAAGARPADDSSMPLGCGRFCCFFPPAIAFEAGLGELPELESDRISLPAPASPGVRLVSIFRPPCA